MPCFSIQLWKPSQKVESEQIQNLASLNMSVVLSKAQWLYVMNCIIIKDLLQLI